jgi:hypothetical protein
VPWIGAETVPVFRRRFCWKFCKKSPGFIDAAGTIAEQDEERQNDLSKGLLNGFLQPFQQPEPSRDVLHSVADAFNGG